MDPVKSNCSNFKNRYDKLGSAGIKGSLYQINLLMIVLLNGMRKVANWRLSTENRTAAQFDDLVFERLPSGYTILLQSKHKEDEEKEVTYEDLMSVNKKSEFGLLKYFFSYQKVKAKFKVQNVVICTNLALDKKTKSVLKEESVDPDSVLHFEGAENVCYGFSGCSFPKLKQSIMYQAKNVQNEEVIISDEDINDFLDHLKFIPNCLDDKTVENIMLQTISRIRFSENLNIQTIQTYIQQKMTDWFKENKGRYLTEVEAKAFFCDMRSNKYCEDLKVYDNIRFKRSNLPFILQLQQKNKMGGEINLQKEYNDVQPVKDPKRISHIVPEKQYILNVAKIYQAIPTHDKDKTLFVNPEETIKVQKDIIDAFMVRHYTILVMVCPNAIEETTAGEICDKMIEILNNYEYKHVILIAKEMNSLATQLRNANINYEIITDIIIFSNLEETTQEEFKRKKLINFQGCTMSLRELFTAPTEDDLNETVTSEMLMKLARGVTSEVGLELPRRDIYYISRSFNRNDQSIFEEDLWRSTEVSGEKVILISDSAGMGKSTVLTSLAISIKKDNPNLWVIRFDLNNYTNIMETTLREGRKSVSIVELLNSQETSRLKSEFDEKLFATSKRVVLMLDGADEISPTYTELVINLIQDSVRLVNLVKIFVTARPHMSKDFKEISELQLCTHEPFLNNHQKQVPDLNSFTLEPFSKVNQKFFLIKYWTETLDLQDDIRKSKCNIYAEALVENISVWINERDRENFAGIPLQTKMLAEIFQDENQILNDDRDWEGCKEFSLSNRDQPRFPTRFDLTQLYKLFFDKKCDVFIKKSNPNRHIPADEALQLQLETCQKFHRALALKVIFESDERLQFFTCYTDIKWPIPPTFANNYLLRLGIVQRQAGRLEFIHRTFAEYFVTDCLLIELESKPVNELFQVFFMNSILKFTKFYVIRAFLESHMGNGNVLCSMEYNFSSYFHRNCVSKLSVSGYLEVFAEEGCARILKCFLECMNKKQREILSDIVNNVYSITYALTLAIRHGHLNIAKMLLELSETFNTEEDAHKAFLKEAVLCSVETNLKTFKFLLCQIDKNGKNMLGRTTLHEAALTGRFQDVEFLVKYSGGDINNKDNVLGWTALHEAVLTGRLDIVKFLVGKTGANVNIIDNDGKTALHIAAYGNEFEIVKFLVKEAGADINIKDKNGNTALQSAIYRNGLKIVKFLVNDAGADTNIKDNDGKTALHNAAFWGKLEVVKFLVAEAGVDTNIKDNDGKMVLHKAACWGRLEVVKFLVAEAGVDINIKDNDGKTALHEAASLRELETVKFLLEQAGADISIKDNDGKTALHKAVYWGGFEIVKYLVEEGGVDINIRDNDGNSALHEAASLRGLETVKFLLEQAGADKNIKDNRGKTALHKAAYWGRLKIVKYLVEEGGVDINIRDNDGKTPLHVAAYRGQLIIVKCLVKEGGADINIRDNDGKTALYEAAYRGRVEVATFLGNEAERM